MIEISSYISITALIAAEELLQQKTQNPPIGIIINLTDSKIIGECLLEANLQGLKITILRDAPQGFWFMYNNQEIIISNI